MPPKTIYHKQTISITCKVAAIHHHLSLHPKTNQQHQPHPIPTRPIRQQNPGINKRQLAANLGRITLPIPYQYPTNTLPIPYHVWLLYGGYIGFISLYNFDTIKLFCTFAGHSKNLWGVLKIAFEMIYRILFSRWLAWTKEQCEHCDWVKVKQIQIKTTKHSKSDRTFQLVVIIIIKNVKFLKHPLSLWTILSN